ncbi:Glycosyl hydrolase family 79 C-terminal beta domain-containing protein 2 [Elsinoe fawcettii]|nr:Glycosyl hydrolase family 79 C-terminal beta domain-containing protein 2 [Elsinoe fawcettii]
MLGRYSAAAVLVQVAGVQAASSFAVPASPPSNASPQLAPAPVGVSIEFFTWPGYNQLPSTSKCLSNLRDLTGTWPPVRIGGTTQDRATYNAAQTEAVTYSVADPKDAPASLTFGPSFFDLASTYAGKVTIGLNRRLNNLQNTQDAAKQAVSVMGNLQAIELGNEPNFFTSSDPIAGGSWSASKDFDSQVSWQTSIGSALGKSNIFSAGVYFGTNSFNIQGLAAREGSALPLVKDYCSHNYPQSSPNFNLTRLMNHALIGQQISPYKAEYNVARSQGKTYLMGETNSATQGGGGISPTFGAAIWVLDYVIQSVILGLDSLYFHQGTIGNCQYCWWGRYSMGAPYYGAYFATLALAGSSQIAQLDSGSNSFGAYAIYSGSAVKKVLLVNSNYYSGSGARSSESFTLTGLGSAKVTAKRLTAASAESRQDRGQNPTVGGQTFVNGTCVIQGAPITESANVAGGSASFTLQASEALLVYL